VFWGMAFVLVLAHAHCTPHQASAFNYIEV
jgi:hypothetical protein